MAAVMMRGLSLWLLVSYHWRIIAGFQPLSITNRQQQFRSSARSVIIAHQTKDTTEAPTIVATGSSTNPDILKALQEATDQALVAFPTQHVDLAFVSVSSLYDAAQSTTVPVLLAALQHAGNRTLGHLIGSSVAGCISSTPLMNGMSSCQPVEWEGQPAVSITLCSLPNVQFKTFHVEDLPDGEHVSSEEWKGTVGLQGLESDDQGVVFFLIPSPLFQPHLDDFLLGLATYFSNSQVVGGIASTVSSLSRAKLFCWPQAQTSSYADGCVGVAMTGDIKVQQMTALGAKPVGGIYQVLKGEKSTISTIMLDDVATDALEDESAEQVEETTVQEDATKDARTLRAETYAKARMPKPPLAEANFVMRTLSDDDQAFMRRFLLVGLEQGGSVGRTASELVRLAQGRGHRFTVHQVATAGMKDGSVTLPPGRVNVQSGTRFRFFVRNSEFAKKEINALWTGYKKRILTEQFDETPSFVPACCFIMSTLDRGSKFFSGKTGYESSAIARTLPGLPCITGFASNAVIGKMDDSDNEKPGVQGSASSYVLIGSKSNRPVYSHAAAMAELAAVNDEEAADNAESMRLDAEDEKRQQKVKDRSGSEMAAPRREDGELLLRRREVHSGRAMTVSTIEWSVTEKTAKPTSTLEGYMWDKETEVDRFRERVPLANLVSQCNLSQVDPTSPKPRDWIGPLKRAAANNNFIIVPECKRIEPAIGSLHRRYDLPKQIREFTIGGVPVMSVNCDAVLFGGSLEDITTARKASSAAAVECMSEDGVVVPPILASDLLLYPYQLYKLRLAGADAVNLIGGALASKDLIYLSKIASALQLQTLVTVTSEAQVQSLGVIKSGLDGIIISNRQLEDFLFDTTGNQALTILKSDALRELKAARGEDFPVLVEGRVGLIETTDENGVASANQYIRELAQAGATGAIVAGGLVKEDSTLMETLESLQNSVH
jgi:indole-3-glycerol phosphate synthase